MNISQELDILSCDLLESALDALAEGMEFSVLISMEDEAGEKEIRCIDDDTLIACLDEAHDYITSLANTSDKDVLSLVRYAICYPGTVETEENPIADALILEFGEKGMDVAYSAYSLVAGVGQGELFSWTDPLPAGEVELLV